jgi:hypothetical protein
MSGANKLDDKSIWWNKDPNLILEEESRISFHFNSFRHPVSSDFIFWFLSGSSSSFAGFRHSLSLRLLVTFLILRLILFSVLVTDQFH